MPKWKKILLAYMDHIYRLEGTTFAYADVDGLNKDEGKLLGKVAKAVITANSFKPKITDDLDLADVIKEINMLPCTLPILFKRKKTMPAIHIATPTHLFGISSWMAGQEPGSDVDVALKQMGPRYLFEPASIDDILAWLATAPTTETSFGDWTDELPFVKSLINSGTHALMRDPLSGYFVLEPS